MDKRTYGRAIASTQIFLDGRNFTFTIHWDAECQRWHGKPDQLSDEFVQAVASRRNHIPRKSLNYQTPLRLVKYYFISSNVKNKLRRRFQTDRPNQKMVSDVTEFKIPETQEKVLQLAIFIWLVKLAFSVEKGIWWNWQDP